ncbi:PQQ-dependent sugar dehydrogenase [Halobacterium wangiae]|uniref:PQQ-dependent sugar dehydrogenase n=1 Tax=Halobacterium wangiae TaxID=2902623 RepID=UPI001E452461|nr:PQQ-dependent sugar dehydrogenase [Halobacterium wangiae]
MRNHHTDAEADRPEANDQKPADESWADGALPVSRRSVLAGVGGAGVAFGLLGYGAAAAIQQTEFRLGGEIGGWQGQTPASIEGVNNPTLELQDGQEYSIVWENLDGQPHNVVVVDADGNQLVRSDIVTEQGATQTVTFTATTEMTEYLCEVHPNTMVGGVSVTDESQTTTTTTEEPGQAGFFTEGTEVGLRTVADGMTAPTDLAVPDDGSGRQFVTDQTGEVWVVTDDGRQETPFVNVSDQMVTLGEFDGSYASQTQEYDERGLLGIDVHPDFADNGRFYLHYSAPPNEDTPEGWDHVEVVSEFTTTGDGSSADPSSERVLLQFQKPQYNHDAGPMAFGPDGYLYVPMGDGGGANDNMYGHVDDWYDVNEGGNGQDVTENLLGDVLRIDVDAQGDDSPYGVPEDNPFVGTDARDEIYAYGFRNPYGISFDSEGNLFVADAGQNLFEEVNVVERGGNYGWNVKEGTHCFSTESPSDPAAITDCPANEPNQAPYDGSPLVDPVVEFPHTYQGESVGITVVGGHRYEADAVPDLQGKYVFGAWTTDPAREEPAGRILAATPRGDFGQGDGATTTTTDNGTTTTTDNATTTTTTADNTTTTTTTEGTTTTTEAADGTAGDVPLDQLWEMEELVVQGGFDYFVRMFGQGPNGEVYVLANQRGVPEGDTGAVLEIVPPEEGDGSA